MDTERTLLEQFKEARKLFLEVEESTLHARDPKFRELMTLALRSFHTCATMFDTNNLLSLNEDLEEIHPSTLKYIAIPYFLGELYQRFPSLDSPQDRKRHIQVAKGHFDKFLATMTSLKIVPDQTKQPNQTRTPEEQRNEKIKRYRREEQIKKLLQELDQLKSDEDADEESEVVRKSAILMLEQYALKAVDALNSLSQEEQIVNHMANMLQEKGYIPPPEKPESPAKPVKPVVIEERGRNIAQTAFLPGWNQPTVSIEQANQADYEEAVSREARQKRTQNKQDIVVEYNDDQGEDTENIYKQREFDAFKDDNPRGSGNTGTKGYKYY